MHCGSVVWPEFGLGWVLDNRFTAFAVRCSDSLAVVAQSLLQRCSRHGENQLHDELSQLREENDKLGQQNRSLQREIEELRSVKERMVTEDTELRPNLQKLELELQHAKDALAALKADRKRLKAEKFDLLNQMKQLYGTLEDKEKELRDFIRNYEQRMRESDCSLQQHSSTNSERNEDELLQQWELLRHSGGREIVEDDVVDKSNMLDTRISHKEDQIKRLQDDLLEARRQLSQLGYYSDHDNQSVKMNGYHTPTVSTPLNTPNGRDGLPPLTPGVGYGSPPHPPPSDRGPVIVGGDGDSCSIYSSTMGTMTTADSSSMLNIHPAGLSRSAEELSHMLSTLDLKKKGTYRRNNSKGTWGSISKVFSRSKSRRSMDPALVDTLDKRTSWSPHNSLCASPLTEETYSEKIRLLEEAQNVHAESWKAATILAWLEVTMGMPHYGPACAENIKSGKVLLELNDSELEVGLGLVNPMHRRKLRLAIEELREPAQCKYPRISELSHLWVCNEWLPGLGLAQYTDAFAFHLVDARMLDHLSKKDLEKYLGVTRKFHQVSIMHGIQLMRMVGFERQTMIERRSMCEHTDGDPLIWTNQRFVQWAQSIDLGEYADNLKDSGVHGALVVLEPSFTADTMATALGIPQSKNIIRRHLMTEMDSIVHPARVLLEQEYFHNRQLTKKEKNAMGSLGRSFSHSYAGGLPGSKADNRRSSLRGSLTRALGLKMKQDLQSSPPAQQQQYATSTLPQPPVVASAAPSPLHLPSSSSNYHHHQQHYNPPTHGTPRSTSIQHHQFHPSPPPHPHSSHTLSSSSQSSHTSHLPPPHPTTHHHQSHHPHTWSTGTPSPHPLSSSSSSSSAANLANSSSCNPTAMTNAISSAGGSHLPGTSISAGIGGGSGGGGSARSTPTPTAKAPPGVETHRRIKSSSDIENITVTPV